jgi:hypothetical protein
MSRVIGTVLGIGIVYGIRSFDLPFWAYILALLGVIGVIRLLRSQMSRDAA